jgi:hypothetical protein
MGHKSEKLASGFSLPSAPKRTDVSEDASLRFVRGGRAPSSRLRRVAGGERVAVYLPPDAATALRVRCAQERRSVSDAVTEAVAEWLKAPGPVPLES